MTYSGVPQGPSDSGSGKALTSGQLVPVCYNAVVQQPPPLGNHLAGALLDAAISFTVAELDGAGEVAFEANLDGSVGDQCRELVWSRTNRLTISAYFGR